MPVRLPEFESSSVARCLAQVADQEGDLADAFFETEEVVEIADDTHSPEWRARREEGFSLRLVRGGKSWLAARDRIDRDAFAGALRQVARAAPQAVYPPPPFEPIGSAGIEAAEEVLGFPTRLTRALRARHVAFPLRLVVRRHHRQLLCVGTRLVPEPETELFYSCLATTPWGRCGALLVELNDAAAESMATRLVERFRARDAPSPDDREPVLVLAPAATAILLHEAVAHSLEADTLALTGRPETVLGLDLGSPLLNVLDDPSSLPEPIRRRTDDEGVPVHRRWLLRAGVVDQPLADKMHAAHFEVMEPGAGRRSNRAEAPVPRSHHLEMPPGAEANGTLLEEAEGGILVQEIDRGSLDPVDGRFVLEVGSARRIEGGEPADSVGRFRIVGRVVELGSHLRAVGTKTEFAGAGWCAKGGHRMPVWCTAPALRLEGLRIDL
jgi:predicted Zn-dependent protease